MKLTTISIPQQTFQHRLLAIGYAAILLIWLATEDNTIWVVSLLGTGLALFIIFLWMTHRWGEQTFSSKRWLFGLPIAGALVGLSAMIGTISLMIFKNAQHGHLVPDFPPELIFALLERTPSWIGAGFMLGVAWSCGVIALGKEKIT